MLIIIEGVDETGKTTLSHSLVDRSHSGYDASYHHSGPPGDAGPLYEYTKAVFERGRDKLLVVDRFHWGELVYGLEYRGESGIDSAQRYWLDLVAGGMGAQMVLCIDSPEAIYDRVRLANDDFVRHDLDHLRRLQERFLVISRRTPLPVWAHSINYPVDADQLLGATARANSYMWIPQTLTDHHLLSVPSPTVLLVGDEPGFSGDEIQRGFPFYPTKSRCGHYLMRALLRTDLWHRVMVVNSLNHAGVQVDVRTILNDANTFQSVVALGARASERLTEQGVAHGKVVHPQYARRFHHHAIDSYATALFTAAQLQVDTTKGGYFESHR